MSGHGHVIPNADGSRARCGGPGLCAVCSREAAQELPRLHAELAQAREERDKARLYCAEVASYICDPMYDKAENRAGIAADAEAMATGEMTGRYLDIKTQTDRAIKAEAERDALRAENDLLHDPVSPSNLRDLGAYLARLLDEDRWPSAERLLNAALSERHALLAERDALLDALQPALAALAAIDNSTDQARQRTGREAEIVCFYAVQRAIAAIDAARSKEQSK